jgi:hypothetical protein
MMTAVTSPKALVAQALAGFALTVWILFLAFQQIGSPHDRFHDVRVGVMFISAACLIAWTLRRCTLLLRRQR